jgi:hypothetical protein
LRRKRRERKERRRRKAAEAKDTADEKVKENGTAKTSHNTGAEGGVDNSTSENKTTEIKDEPAETEGNRKDGDNGGDPNGASVHTATTEGTADGEGYVGQVAEGVGKSAHAIATAPVDLSVALAQGFHNAPRLYGDDFRSGKSS